MSLLKSLVIHFTDDTKVTYEFSRLSEKTRMLAQDIKKISEEPYFMLEAQGTLVMYPRESIRSIQLYPSPDELPDSVLRGVEFVNN